MNLTPAAFLDVFGRLHPMVLHLPIGLVFGIAVLEAWRLISRNPAAPHAPRVLGVVAALAAVLSALMGLKLSLEPGYTSDTVDLHKWLGISFALSMVVMSVLLVRTHARASTVPPRPGVTGRGKAYLASLCVALGILVVTGHLGGEISHGEGFITRPITHVKKTGTAGARAPGNAADASPVPDDILMIFEDRCVICHGEHEQRAGLRLDSAQGLWKGSDAGAVIVPGDAGASELTYRLHLPDDDDEHMPPPGKPQPSHDEITRITTWVAGLTSGN